MESLDKQTETMLIRGHMLKKNWYGKKQLRYFTLFNTGEIMYYKDMTEYKGTILLTPDTKMIKDPSGKEFSLKGCKHAAKSKEEYILCQVDPKSAK